MTVKKSVIPLARCQEAGQYDASDERDRNVIGRKIAEARNRTGLSLVNFSKLLSEYGLTVGPAAISKWEMGGSVPSAYQLIAVTYATGIENGLQYFTSRVPGSELNDTGIRKLAEYKADLIASGNYKPAVRGEQRRKYIEKPVSYLSVSAGSGAFLDEGSFEMVSFPESAVPDGADFGLRVSGDSMEPVYHDGQIVWVRRCEEIAPGEVGIFVYDGEGYIKMYDEQLPAEDALEDFTDSYGTVHKQRVLVSYNESYKPRLISPHAEFQIVGRVL